MRKLIDLHHPFFAPAHRRTITLIVIWGWVVFELATGNFAFALMFAAVGAYCFFDFVIAFDPENYKDPEDE